MYVYKNTSLVVVEKLEQKPKWNGNKILKSLTYCNS